MTKDTARKKQPKLAMVAIDYDRLKSVSGVVRLVDVLLNHSHWHSMARSPRLEVEATALQFAFGLTEATWDFISEQKMLEVRLEYRLEAFARVDSENAAGGERPLFRLECDWDALFKVPDDFSPSDLDAVADFTVANGQLNAFPYVRQYVQDVTGRAGWPPLVLPTFRIPSQRPRSAGNRRKKRVSKE